jgi:DNA invertase Pin-like site-specific DNA recombinase
MSFDMIPLYADWLRPGLNPRTNSQSATRRTQIFGALAEFERNLIRERTQAGLSAARARGRIGGRPKALTGKQLAIAQSLYDDPKNSIAKFAGCSRSTKSRCTGLSTPIRAAGKPHLRRKREDEEVGSAKLEASAGILRPHFLQTAGKSG